MPDDEIINGLDNSVAEQASSFTRDTPIVATFNDDKRADSFEMKEPDRLDSSLARAESHPSFHPSSINERESAQITDIIETPAKQLIEQ